MSRSHGGAAREQYVREVLTRYRATPTVLGRVRRADRDLAGALYDRGVPIYVVKRALLVAAARRVLNNAFASASLPPIRSLHYVLPIVTELQQRPLGPRDIDDLEQRLRQALFKPY